MSKDTIYRADAIKALDNAWINGTSLLDANEAVKQLSDLPSADRPQGEWIEMYRDGFGNMICMCSKCNFHTTKSNYCPNCGAQMKGKGDE